MSNEEKVKSMAEIMLTMIVLDKKKATNHILEMIRLYHGKSGFTLEMLIDAAKIAIKMSDSYEN
jgi:hypothetical protein